MPVSGRRGSISDHYHPWNDEQGQSPFVWTTPGAIAQVTELSLFTAVTCPTMRIHPGVIAQAAARRSTSTSSSSGRCGPVSRPVTRARTTRWKRPDLLAARDHAPDLNQRLRPESGGAGGRARRRAHHGGPAGGAPPALPRGRRSRRQPHRDEALLGADGGRGDRHGVPALAQRGTAWGARAGAAHPQALRAGQPARDARHDRRVDPRGPDPEKHIAAIQEHVDAGFTEVYVGQIGPDQAGMLDFYRREVLPHVA